MFLKIWHIWHIFFIFVLLKRASNTGVFLWNLRNSIVIRNGKIVWKHRPNWPFFFIIWVPNIIRTQSTQACMKYKYKQGGKLYQFKVKGLTKCFITNLRMPGENCSIFNCYSSRAAPGILFFRIPTKNDNEIKLEDQHCCSYYSCVDSYLKMQIKNWTLHIVRLLLLSKTFQYTSNWSKASWAFTHPYLIDIE